jgi:excisionase family DNA binding protein
MVCCMALDMITTTEVADALGCSRRTVHRMVDADELTPVMRVNDARNGTYLFLRSDVTRLAKSRAKTPAA